MASPNATFTELVSTTHRYHKKKFTDNVTKHNALLTWMKEHGNIKTDAAGGTEIVLPISHSENNTFQRFNGLDTLNIGQSDVISSAKYDWQQAAIHVVSSGREIKINNSEERLINLAKARLDVAYATAANNMAIDIYSDGALSNQIGGLAHHITEDGTGTVGGIPSGTYTFWKNKFKEVPGNAAYAALKTSMNELWLSLNRGTDKPDLIVASHDLFAMYEGGLQDNQRYQDAKAASLGFEALKYKSASIIFDDNTNFGTDAEKMYFLNTKYLFLMEHPDARWTEDDEKVPVNQDAVVIPLYWMGNLAGTWRAGQGVLKDATDS